MIVGVVWDGIQSKRGVWEDWRRQWQQPSHAAVAALSSASVDSAMPVRCTRYAMIDTGTLRKYEHMYNYTYSIYYI